MKKKGEDKITIEQVLKSRTKKSQHDQYLDQGKDGRGF